MRHSLSPAPKGERLPALCQSQRPLQNQACLTLIKIGAALLLWTEFSLKSTTKYML